MAQSRESLMGSIAQRFERFPLLLKFLDAREMLSVQVHPGYTHRRLLSPVPDAKTEAWVVLRAAANSRIYAGMRTGTEEETFRLALSNGTLVGELNLITPKVGDAVFIPAGTVHSLGDDVVVFEIQQNSDTTFRLYDWDHIDDKTGKPRALQIDHAFACIDFVDGEAGLVTPVVESETPVERERLFDCDAFWLWRLRGESPFTISTQGVPHVLVCIGGSGQIECCGDIYAVGKGEVWLLPAVIGSCVFRPANAVTLLEIEVPA
jgi:mannose-6-phosphate isomerase